jgi:RHS repeat-associated protein
MATALRTYFRGHTLAAVREQPVGGAAATRYYHFDAQGTTQCLTDGAGAVTDRFASDAWGMQVKRTGTSSNHNWYCGGPGYSTEQARSIEYVRSRWLALNVGHWLSRDPLNDGGRDPNHYHYVFNQPSLLVDPTGLRCSLPVNRGVPVCAPQCGKHRHSQLKRPPTDCPRSNQERDRIRRICKWDREHLDDRKDQFPPTPDYLKDDPAFKQVPQAVTDCCAKCVRPLSDADAFDATGCTDYRDTFFKLPSIYQACIWDHEQRRRQCCYYTCSEELNTRHDRYTSLDCVWNALVRCLGGESYALPLYPECKPPRPPEGRQCQSLTPK